jgi:glycosyltransferase involved in cell wall biosynthesis
MSLLLVIPVYNEEENIEYVLEMIKQGKFYDFIFINDGSTDNTGHILDQLDVNHIDLPVNLGLSGAVQMGYKYALRNNYDYVLQFDGDGQHKIEFVEKLLLKITEGYDIVIGSRFLTKKRGYSLRMLGSRLLSGLIYIVTREKIYDPTSGMRMLNRKMLKKYAYEMNHTPEPDSLSFEIKNGAKVMEVQVEMDDRYKGTSYLSLSNSIKYMVKTSISILVLHNYRRDKK